MAAPQPNKYHSKLQNTRVLIIGGSSGVGFGIAEALLEHGSSVIISSSSAERVSKAVQRLKATYPSSQSLIHGQTCDLSSPDTIESEVTHLFTAAAKDGKFDHIVYTAGDALPVGKLEDFSLRQIQQAGMHLREHVKSDLASSYTITTAGASERPRPNFTVLISYLVGLEGMCKSLARDFAPIRVNVVGLGAVETELWEPYKESGMFDRVKADVAQHTITGTFARVEDVVESYLYLMRDRNVTGSKLVTNGGDFLV